MAHPDDAELWAGGVLLKHRDFGDGTMIVVEKVNDIRLEEAKQGAIELGAELLSIEKYELASCIDILTKFKPTVVITHSPDDAHPDHRRVSSIVSGAAQKAAIQTGFPRVGYYCDSYHSLRLQGHLDLSIIVDVSEWFENKINAFRCHSSQPLDHFEAMVRLQGSRWGAMIGAESAEAFLPFPILGELPATEFLIPPIAKTRVQSHIQDSRGV